MKVSCGEKRPIIIVGLPYNLHQKIKYSINTNNTYFIKQGIKSKMSLMSPTSYQTAPSRDKFSYNLLLNAKNKNQPLGLPKSFVNKCNNIVKINQFRTFTFFIGIKTPRVKGEKYDTNKFIPCC